MKTYGEIVAERAAKSERRLAVETMKIRMRIASEKAQEESAQRLRVADLERRVRRLER